MALRLLFLCFLCALTVISCEQKKCSKFTVCYVYLPDDGCNGPQVVGYAPEEMDTSFTVIYQPNGLFNQPIDTYFYRDFWARDHHYYYNLSDTQYAPIAFGGGSATSFRVNDSRLYLPGAGRVYSFTDVIVEGSYVEDVPIQCDDNRPPSCSRRIVSMKVDGIYRDIVPGKTFYLHK